MLASWAGGWLAASILWLRIGIESSSSFMHAGWMIYWRSSKRNFSDACYIQDMSWMALVYVCMYVCMYAWLSFKEKGKWIHPFLWYLVLCHNGWISLDHFSHQACSLWTPAWASTYLSLLNNWYFTVTSKSSIAWHFNQCITGATQHFLVSESMRSDSTHSTQGIKKILLTVMYPSSLIY